MAIIISSNVASSSLPRVKVNIEMDSWAQLRKLMILNGRGGISVVTWLYGIFLNISSMNEVSVEEDTSLISKWRPKE